MSKLGNLDDPALLAVVPAVCVPSSVLS